MAMGDTSQYNYIKGLEEAEFFTLMDSFKKKHKKQLYNGKSK